MGDYSSQMTFIFVDYEFSMQTLNHFFYEPLQIKQRKEYLTKLCHVADFLKKKNKKGDSVMLVAGVNELCELQTVMDQAVALQLYRKLNSMLITNTFSAC
jgi:hypothetical protein